MRVRIDYALCMGDGRCCEVCPEVFEYDDAQTEVRLLQEMVSDDLRDKVIRAAEECDTGAIVLED